jgi:hypothetical protein
MPKPKSGPVPKRRSVPTILCVNQTVKRKLGVDFDRLIAALQKFVDEYLAPVWGTRAKLKKAKCPRPGKWALLFTDDQDSAKHDGWLGLHHIEGNPIAKVFVGPVRDHHEKVSVAASHELAEMLVDPGINLWAVGPEALPYAYEVCDAVEEETFLVDGIAMGNFVYPAYFEMFRERGSTQFDYNDTLQQPFEISERGYATVLEGGKKVDKFASKSKEDDFKKEDRTDHRNEIRAMIHQQKPADAKEFTSLPVKQKRPKKRRSKR